ncbi:type IV pilus modification PilV family protein [Nitrincola alkalilacustris]|uniref:type IV pilus modification PilV family protein n=1 Tax=Nitrincola alkalilacustris TaxID=1571224 RepID=UPI00197F7D13|nr:type II secretion system protein [Nitrincola alkalilacustris]
MMTQRDRSRFPPQGGFSLLEMLVALVILAFSLGALYQAAGGAARIVRIDQEYAQAVALAESLLADRTGVKLDAAAMSSGVEDGFHWEVATRLLPVDASSHPAVLQSIQVIVEWGGAGSSRRVTLNSIISGEQS